MRKRIVKKQRSLVSSTRIPMDPVGELARSNVNFASKARVKENVEKSNTKLSDYVKQHFKNG